MEKKKATKIHPLEVIILAGGAGTRLRSVVADLPKPMADIRGKPFLERLAASILKYDVGRIILGVSYKREMIKEHFGDYFCGVPVRYSVEEEPLGTGGAIKQAMELVEGESAVVLNGDTYFGVDLRAFYESHLETGADVSIALKFMENCNRYGTVEVVNGRISGFREKNSAASGLINGGIYAVKKDVFDKAGLKGKFSFESDLLEKGVEGLRLSPFESEGYFIDIGVPEDYHRAQAELIF